MENQGEKPPPYADLRFQPQFQSQPVVQNQTEPNTWPAQVANQPFPQQAYHGGFYNQPGTHAGQPLPTQNFVGTGYANRPFVTGVNLGDESGRRRQEHEIRDGIMNAMVTQPHSTNPYSRRTWTYRLTRLGCAFFLVGLVLLIILGVLIVRPSIRDTKLKKTRCLVLGSEDNGVMSCKCGRYCSSHYPCVKIRVGYKPAGKGNRSVTLYQDVFDDKNECSIQPCHSSEQRNDDDVQKFEEKFGRVGQKYTCYYDPSNLDRVYQSKSDNKSDKMTILHCILWPSVIMAASVALMSFLYCRAKGRCCFGNRQGSAGVPYQTLQPVA